MKKVLILVLSKNDAPYRDMMITQMETWDSIDVEGTETVFYCGNSKYNNTFDKQLNLNIADDLGNVSLKTKLAFEFALDLPDWDYIFRPNASAYVDKRELIKYVQTLPETIFEGLMAPYNDTHFIWGPGYIISRDNVKIAAANHWDYTKMDDVALSLMLQNHGVKLSGKMPLAAIHKQDGKYFILTYNTNGEGAGYINNLSELKTPGQFIYRCKQDLKRHEDIVIMKELFNLLK